MHGLTLPVSEVKAEGGRGERPEPQMFSSVMCFPRRQRRITEKASCPSPAPELKHVILEDEKSYPHPVGSHKSR